ncbi:MAG: HD domain-containing protein [Chlamydiia bacterium]
MQIFDPIHNFIPFTLLEEELLSHPFLERLRHIYQLGPAFHVYPGATHSRFSHTIGVMHVASELFDSVCSKMALFEDAPYYRQLVRIGALLHDVGHYPLSHTAELFLPKHEHMVAKIFQSGTFDSIFEKVAKAYQKDPLEAAKLIRQVALGEPTPLPFLSQMVADPYFGADRIDYLLRDSLYTGLNYGKVDLHHLIRSVYLKEDKTLAITPEGIPSCEALLLARHWMHERLYQHHRVRSLAYHYAHVIRAVLVKHHALEDLEAFNKIDDHTIFQALKEFPEHYTAILDPAVRVQAIKLPLTDLERVHKLVGDNRPLWIDMPHESDQTPFEGTRIRIEGEQTFWVYANETWLPTPSQKRSNV